MNEWIRPELRRYASFYKKMMEGRCSEEGVQKMNAACRRLMQGRWLSHKTEAHEIQIPRKDGTLLRLLIVTKKYHKQNIKADCTGLFWIHGGGYMLGLPEMNFQIADLICEKDDVVMVLPDYRLEPYPAPLDDCMTGLQWMKENAEVLGIRSDQLFIGGESAGGGLCLAAALRARDEGKIHLAFMMPLYPMISDSDTDSSADNHDPVWNKEWNHLGWKHYGDGRKLDSPYFSPSHLKDYRNLPPAFTLISDEEPFYEETKAFFHKLYQADVPVMLKEYKGCFHAFDMLAPSADVSRQARKLERSVFVYAQKHFFKEQPHAEKKNEEPVMKEEEEEKEILRLSKDIEDQQEFLKRKREESEQAEEAEKQSEEAEKTMNLLNESIRAHQDVNEPGSGILDEYGKEDVVKNLQKVIEDDTADSLRKLEKIFDDLK